MLLAAAVLAQRAFAQPVPLVMIQDKGIDESSGLASSRTTPGVLYTHNDSGDHPRFFRLDKSGRTTAVFTLKGAKAVDWEDMASATVDGRPYLYLGDIGDNGRARANITVYRVLEPAPSQKESALTNFDTYTLTYPDKPRDCECLMVEPRTGDIWLVTKARDGETVVYRLPKPKSSGGYALTKVATLTVGTGGLGGNLVTGGDISPDGKHVALRTYTGGLEYRVKRSFSDWVASYPVPFAIAAEKQGEAICYTHDGSGLLTTSEGTPFTVSLVKVLDK